MQNNSTWSRVWDAPNALSLWKQYYFPSCPWCGSMDIYQVLVICGVPWLLMFCSYFFNVYFTGSWVPHLWMEAVLDVWIYQSFIPRSDSIAKPFFGPGTLDREVLGGLWRLLLPVLRFFIGALWSVMILPYFLLMKIGITFFFNWTGRHMLSSVEVNRQHLNLETSWQ